MKTELILEVERNTRKQSDSIIWQEMRYGRITASKAYNATRCKVLDGCLVESILGAKLIQTKAMMRGLELEIEIKSPTTEKSCINYIDSDGNIKETCLYQIKIQIYLSNRMRGIFVMSHPDFEK
ncbi:hypothetical protein NQ315_000640 [Exocentrus adspersus]|uniref:YqaJ viral recombinase domain-containing protein n=1 Tax=Exocentrus adspersus TaxID=1586481 RepID=A0AAV8VMU6_9CUCU|nr:hypothetical protein NQ315_000640 [Exocentrus adspersus]